MRAEIQVNSDMLRWAISRAGMELEEFAGTFPQILDWLKATKKPTLKQLEKFAHKVHLPFGYLFLSEPPRESIPFPYFRTQGNTDSPSTINLNVYDTILLLQKRQDWLREYLADLDFDPLPFVGKFNQQSTVEEIVEDIRQTLKLPQDWASRFPNWEGALRFLTSQIEEAGIIMVFNGVVENNSRRKIEVSDCRGFVMVDEMAPFMFVNNADAKAAQMFTILHEMAHIWLGQSAGFDLKQMLPSSDPLESLCDKVAAEFLVPTELFLEKWKSNQDFKALSYFFKVSPIVIGRKALDLGKIDRNAFFDFYNQYIQDFQAKKENQGSGGTFYATAQKRLSLRFAAHVNQAVKTNRLLYRDAYQLTGLKGKTFTTFFEKHLLG